MSGKENRTRVTRAAAKRRASDLPPEVLGPSKRKRVVLELSLLDYGCVRFCPSLVAASVVFLARFTVDPEVHPWTSDLKHHTGYNASELRVCVKSIHDLQLSKKGANLSAIRDKYRHNKFKCVANLQSQWEIPALYFKEVSTKTM